MRALPRPVIALTLAIVAVAGIGPVALAADSLTVTTPYPAIVVGPGSHASFDLTIKTASAARVDLSLTGAPSGWTAKIRGGGFDIEAVQTNGTDPTTAAIDVTVPADAAGSATLTLTARALGQTVVLPLNVKVEASAAGDVTLTTDVPSKVGTASTNFTFNLTLENTTSQDLTYSATAEGPTGWNVEATLTGQTQAASAILKAGSSAGISVSADPPATVVAGTYPIKVTATAGSETITQDLQIEVTGSYSMTVSTPSGVLSGSGSAGSETDQQILITNTGTAEITNITLSGTGASNWKITFDEATIPSIPANQSKTVTAKIVPSNDAIAGDYLLTISATSDAASADTDIRFTVQTGLQWALVGGALIALVVIGVWWVFQRYGRR